MAVSSSGISSCMNESSAGQGVHSPTRIVVAPSSCCSRYIKREYKENVTSKYRHSQAMDATMSPAAHQAWPDREKQAIGRHKVRATRAVPREAPSGVGASSML